MAGTWDDDLFWERLDDKLDDMWARLYTGASDQGVTRT